MYAQVLVLNRHLGDPDPAIRDSYAAAERTGDRLALGITLHAEAVLYVQKNLDKSASLGRRGIEALEGGPQAVSQRMILLSNYIWTLDAMSRMDEGDVAFADMLALGRKYPSGRSQIPVHVFAAQRHYHTGHWDDALAEVEAAGELRPEHGFFAVVGLSIAALIAGHRDNRMIAAARLRTLDQMPISDQLIQNLGPWLSLGRALAAERDGRPAQALEVLAPMLDTGRDYDIGDRFRWTPELVRIALAVGERDAAEQAARLADQDVERERLPLRVAAAKSCWGLLAAIPGRCWRRRSCTGAGGGCWSAGWRWRTPRCCWPGATRSAEARDDDRRRDGGVHDAGGGVGHDQGRGAGCARSASGCASRGRAVRRPPGQRVGGADPGRAAGGFPRFRWPVQPGDRDRAVLVPADGADSCGAHPGQAGFPVPGPVAREADRHRTHQPASGQKTAS